MIIYRQLPLMMYNGEPTFFTNKLIGEEIRNSFDGVFEYYGLLYNCILDGDLNILKAYPTDTRVEARWIAGDCRGCKNKYSEDSQFINTLLLSNINNAKEIKDNTTWYNTINSGSTKGYVIYDENKQEGYTCKRNKSTTQQRKEVLADSQVKIFLLENSKILDLINKGAK